MTVAEIIVITLVLYFIYRLLRPVQLRLEVWLSKKLRGKSKDAPIIEIKDYEKRN